MIHPTAIIDPAAELDEGVEVGPYVIIGPRVRIGRGTSIGPHAVLRGPTDIGCDNRIFQFASVGEDPQDKKYAGEETRLEFIGYPGQHRHAGILPPMGHAEYKCVSLAETPEDGIWREPPR